MACVLIVDDEEAIAEMLCMHLSLVGYACRVARDASAAREELARGGIDAALLDVMMPGEDGFSLAQDFIAANVPVLFLTAKTSVPDRVRGLHLGAEDYILKPFEPAELLARVENVLRRHRREDTRYADARLEIDFGARIVRQTGREISLTALEFDLLALLVRRRGTALSREALLLGVWSYAYSGETRTVDVHVQRLRRKLGGDAIETVYKYGYRYRPLEDKL